MMYERMYIVRVSLYRFEHPLFARGLYPLDKCFTISARRFEIACNGSSMTRYREKKRRRRRPPFRSRYHKLEEEEKKEEG